MALLFVNYKEGVYDCAKKARLTDGQAEKIKALFKKFGMKEEQVEIWGEGITYVLDGMTYYLKDESKFGEINKKIDEILK